MPRSPLLPAFNQAVVTMLAALAALACTLGIDPEPGPAILAVVLCLSLSRSQPQRAARGQLEAAIALPVVSVAALGVATLLRDWRWVGAAAYVAAIALSIWMRRWGDLGRKVGSWIALPFVVLLVTPAMPATRVGPVLAALMPVVVALLALFWVDVLHALARRVRLLPAAPSGAVAAAEDAPAPPAGAAPGATAGGLRPRASTRMALQMAVALGAAFAVGYLAFPGRWSWIVLTAFIVGSGNQGRLDVVHKSALRIAGAAAGTALASLAAAGTGGHGAGAVALILLAVFLGTWLRPVSYAWWALFVTLALALLQGFAGAPSTRLLALRLEEIVIGAAIGVAAHWFVLPVRSTDVLRRRIADALAALSEALDPATPSRDAARFVAALERVERVAPAFRAARRASRVLGRTPGLARPAEWLDALAACRAPALALIEGGRAPETVRKAVGAARRALREPQALALALENLRASLARA